MADTLEKLQRRLIELEEQIEQEWDRRRAAMSYRIERGRVVFDARARAAHRQLRVRFWLFLRRSRPMVILTAPVIYAMILPFSLMDLFVSLYQAICFPVYGIARVRRRDHIAIDRQHLAYLNGLQKLNCIYCGYCNGVASYAREVAGRTEKYWCPIKHARRVRGAHEHYAEFVDYGDAEGFVNESPRLRRELRHAETGIAQAPGSAQAEPQDEAEPVCIPGLAGQKARGVGEDPSAE